MLKRVSIQNFKSLKDVTLDLQKVNLLIGPNNSGKTNFLKALEFFDFSVLQDYVAAERQASNVRFMRSASSMCLELTFQREDEELVFLRRFNFENTVDVKSSQRNLKKGLEVTKNDEGYPDVLFLRRQLNSLRIYRPDPNKLTQPGPVGAGIETVNADASNLVGFLDQMLGKYRRTVFSRIEDDLHTCISEFDEIKLEDAKPTDELRKLVGDKSFKRFGLSNSSQGATYWADELSEGTLYFLALLCIIHQPNPPKLLLLEEPEKGIHPRRIREVMDFIFQLAEQKDIQVILTTHNENVLNEFTSMPEAVFVFEKDEEGVTRVKNLLKDIIEPSHQLSRETGTKEIDFASNLGENWMYGLLGGVPQENI
ncbi:SMC domain protein [Fibrisoma limi BUZ 3]|uniref:SMC domain protein n=1 Tax=Fibrisoma limi BUZ 3 TaxID=1185876 RepID=I2GBU7_9BACT|nr:AAA family ATPase [Fibrisoma limi]CCH51371.1 SMC domain protein [Fibrisoma limi BUZ 3]